MDEINNFLDSELTINDKDYIVVGVSGGPDSMALLNVLMNKYPHKQIVCAHVNHNHRKESDKEESYLKNYCNKNNIIFEPFKIEKYKNDKFTENEAREIRYSFFDNIMKKYHAKYLFTAHHGDDLVETILMKIVRGSTLKGYGGISLKSKVNDYEIVRPFLFVTKDDLKIYCDQNHIKYFIDASNSDDNYTRNRYRKNVLKFLKEENKDVHKKFLKFSNLINEYDAFVNKEAENVYKRIVIDNKINIALLLKQDDLIIKLVLEKYFLKFYKNNINKVTDLNIKNVLKILKSSKNNICINLPCKITAIKSYNNLYFDKQEVYNTYAFVLNNKVKLPNKMSIMKVDETSDHSNFMTAIDSKDITLPIIVRTRKIGDKMNVLGLNKEKSISDILTNSKVKLEERKNYPVVTDAKDNIIWLPGVKKSKYDKSKQGKYDIILRYQKEE